MVAYTEADLMAKIAALDEAQADGRRQVAFPGRAPITYRTDAELAQAVTYFRRLLDSIPSTRTMRRA